jgi:hypothetical protein
MRVAVDTTELSFTMHMNHSKEEIRQVALNVLASTMNQFRHLEHAVADVFARNEGRSAPAAEGQFPIIHHLTDEDQLMLLEVFWDLFLERVITLGADPVNYQFPYFRPHSSAGAPLTTNQSAKTNTVTDKA